MREVARRSGCTHQAPYHYFANREAILAAVVAEGFRELAEGLEAANEIAKAEGPAATSKASSNAYVSFAIRNPGVFQVMFRPDMINHAAHPNVVENGDRARDALRRLARRDALRRLARILFGDDASTELEVSLWAKVHGLAGLLISGPLGYELPTKEARLAYAEKVNGIYVDQFEAGRVDW